MLRKLSLRNAKRQFGEYALFFVTLSCAAAVMYAFNALLFSESVQALPDMEILPWLIVAASLVIVLILGRIVSYMISYMFKRRSREIGIYMVSGMAGRKIVTLLFWENGLIGLAALGFGILLGMLFSQLLEAVLLNLCGIPYILHAGFSLSAVGLTVFYFVGMLLYAVWRNGKWIRRVQLRELLCYDRANERPPVQGSSAAVVVFGLSVLCGGGGFAILCFQPIGKGYDVLIGFLMLAAFIYGFFRSVPAFLAARFGGRADWKYRRHRLVTFRNFTAKIDSVSAVMGMLSVLFMLAITLGGIGTTIGLMVTKNVEAGAFDIMILHEGEMGDFSRYGEEIRETFSTPAFPVRDYSYGIYTNGKKEFRAAHDQAVVEAGRTLNRAYAEFQNDTCMAQRDYLKLREVLGYENLQLDPALCYVHCIPALSERFRKLLDGQGNDGAALTCGGYSFAKEGIFSEPFSQLNDYGNGAGYILVAPDDAVARMQMLYSVYAAVTPKPLAADDLQNIMDACEGLVKLEWGTARSGANGMPTRFRYEDKDYLSGKWLDKTEIHYFYPMLICLFYMAVILEITGAAILAIQVLGDWKEKQRQDRILRQLGMSEGTVRRLHGRQLTQIFALPILPAIFVSGSLIYICVKKMLRSFFQLPVMPDLVWIGQAYGISLLLFAALYGVYYAAARICYGHIRSDDLQ